ncbi:MAG: DNA methylase [Candidatus Cloacimonas sp. 4484_209]|nr:MAG: DNA methylase [Candidatus Cloacimonas sp. 4484_209]
MKVYYNPNLKEIAKKLRKNSTLSEVLLWRNLKGKKMMGFDFHRQKPIERYIVDFFCPKLNLIIEIDGESHNYKYEIDEKRQRKLEMLGFHFLRFLDTDVKHKMEGVLLAIEKWIKEHTPKSPLIRGDF